jgi:hypothetical protein
MHVKRYSKILKGTDNLGNLAADGRLKLKWISKKYAVRMYTR